MYRVTWIENDGTVSKTVTTDSEYYARELHKSGLIATKIGNIRNCILEKIAIEKEKESNE